MNARKSSNRSRCCRRGARRRLRRAFSCRMQAPAGARARPAMIRAMSSAASGSPSATGGGEAQGAMSRGRRQGVDRGRGLAHGVQVPRAAGQVARGAQAGDGAVAIAARRGCRQRAAAREEKPMEQRPVSGEALAGGGVRQGRAAHVKPADAQRVEIGRRSSARPRSTRDSSSGGTASAAIEAPEQVTRARQRLGGFGGRGRTGRAGARGRTTRPPTTRSARASCGSQA